MVVSGKTDAIAFLGCPWLRPEPITASHLISKFAMATRPDSNLSKGQITELSQDELEAISGGLVNVSLTILIAEESSEFVTQDISSGGSSYSSISGQTKRSLFGLKLSGTFESMDHFSSFLTRLMDFLGRR
ncbi:MAG: hypothetical protein ACKO24_16185 [Leptolyngbyaceae cyanobacterium]